MSLFTTRSAFTFLVVFNTLSFGGTKTSNEYWKDVGLKFNQLDIGNETCHDNERQFLGCFHSVNAALSFEKDPLTLIPKSRLSAEAGFGKPTKEFATAVVVTPKKLESEDLVEIYEGIRMERKLSNDAILALYRSNPKDAVDFDLIVAWLKTNPSFLENESAIVGAMINAEIAVTVDPHTAFIPRAEMEETNKAGAGDFAGIGATLKSIKKQDKRIVVVQQPLEGGPAVKAGVRANDVITHIDGVPIEGLALDEVVLKIKGPIHTDVKLTIDRGPDTIEIVVKRDLIEMKNVTAKAIGSSSDIAYIKLSDFMRRDAKGKTLVYSETRAGLEKLLQQNPKGILFDLRDNSGGLLPESVRIASLFLKTRSLVVSTQSLKTGTTQQSLRTRDKPLSEELPLVVLINARSASASEIVAGALQDHQRAFLVGQRTFGKGTVQEVRVYPYNPKLLLASTIEYFLLPSGRSNQVETVWPDVEVFTNPNPTAADKIAFREEDEYAVLPKPVGKQWVQPRPDKVKKLEACLAQGQANAQFAASASAAIAPDYQLLVGIDAVHCLTTDETIWSAADTVPVWKAPQRPSFVEKLKQWFKE
jgi:C-terminal peptidase prc